MALEDGQLLEGPGQTLLNIRSVLAHSIVVEVTVPIKDGLYDL